MIVAALILILSTGLFFFCLQVTCQRILRCQFAQEYLRPIVEANSFEFLALRESLQELGTPVQSFWLGMKLKCDFLALTYLLKHTSNVNLTYSNKVRLLMVYFRCIFLSLPARRLMGFSEKQAILKLTSILEYFANVVGQRVNTVRFGKLTFADYLLNI